MALDNPQLTKIRLLAAKAETSTGVAEALTADDAEFIVLNPQMAPDEQTNERELPASRGQEASLPGADSATLTFRTEAVGNGASGLPAWATTFLPACDFVATGSTYALTQGTTTLTFALYENGTKRVMYGCKGTFKITAEKGAPAYFDWTFKGCYTDTADDTILAPTFPTIKPPVNKGITLSIHSVTPRANKIEIDLGGDVQLREDLTATSGYHAATLVDYKPTLVVDPERVLVATKDWAAIRAASTEDSFNYVLGSAANNTITIAGTKAQLRNKPVDDRHGLAINNLTFQLNGASPFTIAFS